MKIITTLLLCSSFFLSSLQAQRDFICELQERKGVFAMGGARMTLYTFSKKKAYNVESIQDSFWVVKDTLGNILMDKLKNFITKPSQLIVFQNQSGKWGVLRKDLTTLIEPIYDDLTFEGIEPGFNCLVRKNNRWGIVDSLNQTIVPIKYDKIQFLNSQMAFLEKGDKKYLFYVADRSIVEINDFCIKSCGEKKIQNAFLVKKDQQIGVMDMKGNTIIRPKYDEIKYVELDNKGLSYYFLVIKNRKKGIINKHGKVLFPAVYDRIDTKNITNTLDDAIFILNQRGNQYLYYKGKISNQKFQKTLFNYRSQATSFIFLSLNRYGVYDYALDKVLIEPTYLEIESFQDSLYFANKGGKFGIISADNKELLAFQYDKAPEYLAKNKYNPESHFKVMQNGLFGYVNEKFETVLAPKYHVLNGFSDGLARVMKDHKWGYLNYELQEAIPLKFDHALAFRNGEAKVLLNEKEFFINNKGECVRDCQ